MSLLTRIATHLRTANVPFALIGASALAAHGISRSTLDQDLLVTARDVLAAAFWRPLPNASVDVRIGDAGDPLAGVVRLTSSGERQVDVVVGYAAWMADALKRAVSITVDGSDLPVVTAADLVLLKLYAGGTRDLWDIQELLALSGSRDLKREVERLLATCPERLRVTWTRVSG